MKRESQINLDTISVKLFDQHLAQAIDELRKALEIKIINSHDDYLMEWRLSSSSIVHSMCALDSLVNYFGFEYFFNKKSNYFISENERDYSLKRLLRSWDNLSLFERLAVVLDKTDSESLPPQIEARIRELNDLRNWIVHGRSFTITILHEFIPVDENTVRGVIHDSEDSVDWKKKFPSTKFNSPARLNKDDAKKAFSIVVEAILFILHQFKWFHITLKTFHNGVAEFWLDSDVTVDGLFKEFAME